MDQMGQVDPNWKTNGSEMWIHNLKYLDHKYGSKMWIKNMDHVDPEFGASGSEMWILLDPKLESSGFKIWKDLIQNIDTL